MPAANSRQPGFPVDDVVHDEPANLEAPEAGCVELRLECVGRGESRLVDRSNRREDRDSASRSRSAPGGRWQSRSGRPARQRGVPRRTRPVDPRDGSRATWWPGRTIRLGTEGSRRCPPGSRPRRERGTGGGDHPVALVDAPDLGMCIRGERGCEPARAASDIQDAPATEVAELDQGLEATPPGLIRRTERVVEAGARVEIGATTLGHDSVCAGRRDRRAPRGTRTGRPCSAKGISMMSKSRGTTVSGKSSPASAAASFPA